MEKVSIFWFRRDLRLEDNAALYHALKGPYPVIPLFIFDKNILDKLEDEDDARVTFLHQEINRLKDELKDLNSDMVVLYDLPEKAWSTILSKYNVGAVYTNRDYEPYAKERDKAISDKLAEKDIPFRSYKDQVIFDRSEVLKSDGDPYVVFTPYSKVWKSVLSEKMVDVDEYDHPISYYFQSYPCEKYYSNFQKDIQSEMPKLKDMGFQKSDMDFPSRTVNRKLIKEYKEKRNFPAVEGTSRLGLHFRFGTISIREKARRASQLSDTFLNELIWRDFYSMILDHFPHVADGPFREKYSYIPWRDSEEDFQAWCEGKTGYPIVDAGMRQLNQTGYMHNRVRMIVASFLTKHLLINWTKGAAYFARRLLDFDLSSNNGGWQWAAGTGTDAAPYFRIFNPTSQMEKFDKQKKYIKEWVPEFGTPEYPEPIVDHKMARQRCLDAYKEGLATADKEME